MLEKQSVSVLARERTRWFLVAVGMVVILIGVTNIFTRLFEYVGGSNATQTAFAPLGTLTLGESSTPPTNEGFSSPFLNVTFVATTTPITPARLTIASIGVHANVEQVGKKSDGSMATPSSFQDVAWYKPGSKPGDAGSAVIAGHVNNALTTSGVFEHLLDVKVGDYITVSDTSGKTLVYVVTKTAQYNLDSAPLNDIFTQSGPSQLVLITCDGAWDAAAHSYNKRLVVYAQLTNK